MRLDLNGANVGRLSEVPDHAGGVFGGGDADTKLDARGDVVDGFTVSKKLYEAVASIRVKLEREVAMLEGVTHCDDLSGGEPEPEVGGVGADVDGLQLVVVDVENR